MGVAYFVGLVQSFMGSKSWIPRFVNIISQVMLNLFYNRDFIVFIDTEFLIHNISRIWYGISAKHPNFLGFLKG